MIAGVLNLLLANSASFLAANALRRTLGTRSRDVDLLLLLLSRLLLISAVMVLCGMLGILRASVIGVGSAIALVVLIVLRQHRDFPSPDFAALGRGLSIAIGVVSLRLLLQVWIFAPHQGDALAYHLPKIAEWVRAGAFTRELGAHTHVTYPAGFELVETWWVLFLHHDVLIEMAGAEFLVVAFVAVETLAKRCGLEPKRAAFAALLYSLSPGFYLGVTSCMNDSPAAALTLALFALTLARLPLPAVLMAAGLGIGVKPTVGFALPGIALLVFLQRKEASDPVSMRRAWAWASGAVGLLVGSYWPLRNLAWYGNPFYPMGESNFQDPTYVQFGPRGMSLVENLTDLANIRLYDGVGMLGPNVDHMAGWGACAFGCGLIALVDVWKSSPILRRLAMGVGVSMLGTLLMVQHDPWSLKYLFYVPAVLIIAFVVRLREEKTLRWVGAATLLISFATTMFSYDLQGPHAAALWSMGWRDRSAVSYSFKHFGAGSREESVGYFGGPTGPSYLLYRPDFSRRVVFLRSISSSDLLDRMKEEHLRDLYAPKATPQQLQILDEATAKGFLRKRDSAWWERLP